MENLNYDQFNELISKYKDSFYVICAGKGLLKSNDCAAYISLSEESAKKYFDSIINDLPEELKEFSVLKVKSVEDIYSFNFFFNGPSFRYIYIIDYGIVDKEIFIKKNLENVEYIKERLKNHKDNDPIYSVYTKENNAFSPEKEFRQFFFSNSKEVNEFIKQYNNESLGLYSGFWELDDLARGALNDLLDCTFDGRYCSGWDIITASAKLYSESYLNEQDIEEILKNNKLRILAATDDSNYVMRKKNDAIFFTTDEKAQKFLERNKKNVTHEFQIFTIEKNEAFNKLVLDSRVIYIDGERHVLPITFLIGAGLRPKPKKWDSEEEVKEKAISLWNKDKLYIILSINYANLENNTSVPFIFSTNPFSLCIFENYEDAKKFVDNSEYPKLNDKYPIGVIDNSKAIWSLKTTLSIANALNIPDVEFNPEEYECIHFKIADFFEFNGEKLTNNFSTLVPENGNTQNVQLRFNPFSFDNIEDNNFYLKDFIPADEIEQKLLNEFKKIGLVKGYSENAYKLFYYVLEHFIKYAKSTKNIKFYYANTVLDFIKKRNENDFSDMIKSYDVMDKSIIDENWKKTIEDVKEIVNKVDTISIENLLKELRDVLFE